MKEITTETHWFEKAETDGAIEIQGTRDCSILVEWFDVDAEDHVQVAADNLVKAAKAVQTEVDEWRLVIMRIRGTLRIAMAVIEASFKVVKWHSKSVREMDSVTRFPDDNGMRSKFHVGDAPNLGKMLLVSPEKMPVFFTDGKQLRSCIEGEQVYFPWLRLTSPERFEVLTSAIKFFQAANDNWDLWTLHVFDCEGFTAALIAVGEVAKKLVEVTAWKYEEGADVPIWVARKCHDLGNGKLTANTLVGRMPIEVGQYVVLMDEDDGHIVVVPAKDFEEQYKPVPTATAAPRGKPVCSLCWRDNQNDVAFWSCTKCGGRQYPPVGGQTNFGGNTPAPTAAFPQCGAPAPLGTRSPHYCQRSSGHSGPHDFEGETVVIKLPEPSNEPPPPHRIGTTQCGAIAPPETGRPLYCQHAAGHTGLHDFERSVSPVLPPPPENVLINEASDRPVKKR